MGLVGKILVAKLVTKLTERLDRAQRDPPARAEYIPAGRERMARRRNPKLVATLGAAAIVLLAAGLSRRRHS